jgi:hypothetical protein
MCGAKRYDVARHPNEHVSRAYKERYIKKEHMDVWCDLVSFAQHLAIAARTRLPQGRGSHRVDVKPQQTQKSTLSFSPFLKSKPGIWIIKDIHIQLALAFRNNGRNHRITRNINHGAGHVEQTVYTQYQGNTFCW